MRIPVKDIIVVYLKAFLIVSPMLIAGYFFEVGTITGIELIIVLQIYLICIALYGFGSLHDKL